MKMGWNRVVQNSGQAASVLNLLLAVFVIVVLGIFSVELSRYMLAKDQLKSSVEAAALCCETALASTGSPDQSIHQSTAENTGLSLFQQNSILGQVMSNATVQASVSDFNPNPGEAQICFQFLDPITHLPVNNSLVQAEGAAAGTLIQATGCYSYAPIFGQFLGMANAQFTVQTSAISGIPQLDVIIVYDVSASQNYETPVSYVQRYWDQFGIEYMLAYNSAGTAAQGFPPDISVATPPGINGYQTWPNGLHPQVLDSVENCSSPPLQFSEEPGSPVLGLAGAKKYYAVPPGNCPMVAVGTPHAGNSGTMSEFSGSVNGQSYLFLGGSNLNTGSIPPRNGLGDGALSVVDNSQYKNYFTDMVVNIDGNKVFTNYTAKYNGQTYNFPCGAALVEAARGNLEESKYVKFANIQLDSMGLSKADIKPGYLAAYMAAAKLVTQPMYSMQNSVEGFVQQLATASDVHFGLITFNDYVGSDSNTVWPSSSTTPDSSSVSAPDSVSSDFPYPSVNSDDSISTTNTYPLPNIMLSPASNITQSTIISTLPTLAGAGNRNVAAALQAAVNEFKGSGGNNYARPGANQAIILVTAGPPTVDLNDNTGASALSDAIKQAQAASVAGIPIYCVSVAQLSTDNSDEDNAYNNITTTAGYGSKYYRVNWSNPTDTQSALTTAFANIARRLVSVVH